MPIQITMPSLAAGAEEATLVRWLKAEGEPIRKGEAIAEVETDKATMEMEAEETGTLGRILVPSGSEGVAVNTPIALLLQQGESTDILRDGELPDTESSEDAAFSTPGPTTAPPIEASGAPATRQDKQAADQRRVRASPLARRLAEKYGVPLVNLRGSGPHGRIV